MNKQSLLRVGVDIGGTFTDLVMIDPASGALFKEKVLTTPDDPSRAVLEGLHLLLRHENGAASVDALIHGTTLVANAIIERKGVKVALVTTQGFRDVIEIGRERRYDIYDLFIELPEPLVLGAHRYEVAERIGPSGEVIVPLDEAEVAALADRIAGTDIEAVAVSLLHSFQNPSHERKVRDIFRERAPNVIVSISSDVAPVIGEYERTVTTVANAYVQPIFKEYIRNLDVNLKEQGFRRDLLLMLSDGSLVHKQTAIECPVRLVQSGPAGGAQAVKFFGDSAGFKDIICFDMGGTTAKSCLIEAGQPIRSTDFEVARTYRFAKGSGLPLRVPVIDMIEIGAGGGSIASIDSLGFVKVGPESASSVPGPACYGLGGERATVTDADLVLGYLDGASFLGGAMQLSREKAEEAIRRDIAEPLGVSVVEAAWAIHDAVNDQMAHATSIYALEKGRKVGNYSLTAIGGAGPVHACNLSRKLGLKHVIGPRGAGVASALGFTISPIAFELLQARVERLDEFSFPAVKALVGELEARCLEMVETAGVPVSETETQVWAYMRYVGQGYEIDVKLPIDTMTDPQKEILERFDEAYRHYYGRSEDMDVEIVAWRVVVSGPEQNTDGLDKPGSALASARKPSKRPAYFPEWKGFRDVDVFDRQGLAAGFAGSGPAIIEERESTMVIPPDSSFKVDDAGNIIVELH